MTSVLMLLLLLQNQPAGTTDGTAAQLPPPPEPQAAPAEPRPIEPKQIEQEGAPPPRARAGVRKGRPMMRGPMSRQRMRPVEIPRVSWQFQQPYDPATYGVGTPQMWHDYYQGRAYKQRALWWLLGSIAVIGAGTGASVATDDVGYVLGGSLLGLVLGGVGWYYAAVGDRLIQDSTLHILMSTQPGGGPMPGAPMMAPPPPGPGMGPGVM